MGFDNVNVNVSGPVQPTSTYKTKVLKGNHSFASQVTEPNMKYVIKHNFDLGGESVTIPEGCLIEFDGGSISNGTLVGQSTILIYNQPLNNILTATLEGTWRHESGVKADEEDITDINGELKFKDKAYAPANYSGLGRKILRKNIVNGVNTLTQSMINQPNTIYVIQYDFTLTGNVTIPANCILKFDGGSISGAYTITGQNTDIIAPLSRIFNTNVILRGNWICEGHIRWFGAHPDKSDNTVEIQQCLNNFWVVNVDLGHYKVASTIKSGYCRYLKGSCVYGDSVLIFTGTGVLFMADGSDVGTLGGSYVEIEGIKFKADTANLPDNTYVHVPGTTGISSARAASGELSMTIKDCEIQNFEYGITSKVTSYNNKIIDNVVNNVRYPFGQFHANNLQVVRNRVSAFETAIQIYGSGPTNIENNDFEHWSRFIIRTTSSGGITTGPLNISNNYIETSSGARPSGYDGNIDGTYSKAIVISGSFASIIAQGNEMQVLSISQIFNIATLQLISFGNRIHLTTTSPIVNIYTISGRYNNKLLEYVYAHDTCKYDGNTPPSTYVLPNFSTYSDTKTKLDAVDPLTRKLCLKTKPTNLNPTNGYTVDTISPMAITMEGNIILEGILKKTSTATDVLNPILTLPDTFADLYVRSGLFDEIYLTAYTTGGNAVLLKYVYSTRNLYFVSGDSTGNIVMNGLTIPVLN